mmetsp:Transcript_70665/g.110580  ORF Transcript_70665/g.110580 Transcript_70665/m.110580 type:complete len:85 (+) Transcript_70665:1072-1326(+)
MLSSMQFLEMMLIALNPDHPRQHAALKASRLNPDDNQSFRKKARPMEEVLIFLLPQGAKRRKGIALKLQPRRHQMITWIDYWNR